MMGAPTDTTLIDVVDEADQPVGVIRRGDVFDQGARFRTVHVIVINRRGEILLQRPAEGRERNPSRWGSSVAGYLFAGESYFAAATRRMKEEIRLETTLTDLGQIRMSDMVATKFVHVFTAEAEAVDIGDPVQIQAVRFWDVAEIESQLEAVPDAFTETFTEVFAFYRQTLR